MSVITVFSPAKLNLFLAVTGRRSDGYHDLVSVAAPLTWGDELKARSHGPDLGSAATLECAHQAVPRDEGNLVLQAARRFMVATGWGERVHFVLTKRIPLGAGLGGGSSNAVAALLALNQLAGRPLNPTALAGIAAQLGSDCALFLSGGPVVMRGRGEQIEPLDAPGRARLTGRRVLVFKPAFGIATPWAYARLAAMPGRYLPAVEAEDRLARWRATPDAPAEALLFNNLESAALGKHLALPALLTELRERCGLAARMSGSGSACYVLLPESAPVNPVTAVIRAAWGEDCFIQETVLA